MQINRVGINANSLCCKANFFTVERCGKSYKLSKISTDNEEQLGQEPILRYYHTPYFYGEKAYLYEDPMIFDGKYYTADTAPSTIDNYQIYYKDTNRCENKGIVKHINPLTYTTAAIKEDRRYNKLPSEEAFVKGETQGIIVNSLDIPKDVPVILVLDEIPDMLRLLLDLPNNVKGIITSARDMYQLEHQTSILRDHLSTISTIWNKEKFNNIKNQAGKWISVNNESGFLEYKEIDPNASKQETLKPEKVEIPILKNVEKLLNFDELTPQNCGNKGYRLGVIQKLVEEGMLKDITVPNGFVIPEGYIRKYQKDIQDVADILSAVVDRTGENLRENNRYDQEIVNKLKELGLPTNNNLRIIVRSNFNTEDLGSFSSAGIYSSSTPDKGSIIYCTSKIINESLMENKITKYVHKKYGIEDNQIQPSVIVQERIPGIDYSFTVYSDDGDNNILIELLEPKLGYVNPGSAIIRYNKGTKELTLERSISPRAKYVLDEEGNIIEKDYGEDRIKNKWNTLIPLLGIVTSGALTLENFFKHAQDIEGGIKNGKVYFWQTRDIVAKAVKRI